MRGLGGKQIKQINMKQIYIIQDWTGTRKFAPLTFNTIDEASDFLLQEFDNDEDLQEFGISPLNKQV